MEIVLEKEPVGDLWSLWWTDYWPGPMMAIVAVCVGWIFRPEHE